MSVNIVPDDTISVMVTAALWPRPYGDTPLRWSWGNPEQYREITRDNATEVGQMLVDANYASYAERYRREAEPHQYRFKAVAGCEVGSTAYFDRPLILASVAKAIRTYDYNACEMPGWGQSEAESYCNALVWKLTRYIHQGPEEIPLYVDRAHFAQFTDRDRQRRLLAERKAAGIA